MVMGDHTRAWMQGGMAHRGSSNNLPQSFKSTHTAISFYLLSDVLESLLSSLHFMSLT